MAIRRRQFSRSALPNVPVRVRVVLFRRLAVFVEEGADVPLHFGLDAGAIADPNGADHAVAVEQQGGWKGFEVDDAA